MSRFRTTDRTELQAILRARSGAPFVDLCTYLVDDLGEVVGVAAAGCWLKDTFGDPVFTQHQWDYAKTGGRGDAATPQVIVNGRGVLTGNRRADVDAAIARYDRGTQGPAIVSDGRTAVLQRGVGKGTLWLVRFDPRKIAVPIRAGENGGRTIPHHNIVRQPVALGNWSGPSARFTLPAERAGLRTALLLQACTGGAIVAGRNL